MPRVSCHFGVEWVFEKNIHLIPEHRLGFPYGADWELKYGLGVDANGSHTPGLEVLFNVDDNSVAVEIDGIDGKTHREGVDAVGGMDPKTASAREVR
jgi:hypothetical protein